MHVYDPAQPSRINEANERASRRGKPGVLTNEDWQRAVDYWQGYCAYCWRQADTLTLDHYLPLCIRASPGSTADNILPACWECNNAKNCHRPVRWLVATFGITLARERLEAINMFFNWLEGWQNASENRTPGTPAKKFPGATPERLNDQK